jgi:hypothetical protein
MAASTNQQSASVIVTDDPRTRAKTLLLRHVLWRRRQERPSFPHRYAERRQRSGSLLRIHQVPRSQDPDLCRLHQKAAEKFEGQEGRNLGVVLDHEMKKRLYRDLAKRGPGRAFPEQKHLVAERHGLQPVRGKIPVPTFGSNRTCATAKGLLWPRTRHRSLPGKRSGGKSPRRTLHLCPRRRCFETAARAGSA